jgi:hypothetical protein
MRRLAVAEHSAPKGFGMPGVHRRAGVFIAHGAGIPALLVPAFGIADAGALVYGLAGVTPPEALGARLPPFLADLSRSWCDGQPLAAGEVPTPRALSGAEEAVITNRLRGLGYIE